jgi:DNA-binding response OmpR family regulator
MSEKKTILMVDDDPDIVEQVAMILGRHGYRVVAAGGEEEGEEALLKGGYDLALFDLMMEESDSGFRLCHRSKHLYPDVPVILMTSVSSITGISFDAPQASAGSWIKADLIIDKPARPEQLIAEIRRLLGTIEEPRH